MSARVNVFINGRSAWDTCEEACRELSDSFFRVMDKRNRGLKLQQRAWRDDA
jgi:hypothetical protein